MAVAVHTRQTSHLPCAVGAAGALNPRNYEDRFGSYYETFVRDGNVWARRSFYVSPPFAWEVQVTDGGGASYPWLFVLPWRRAVLLFEEDGDVWWTFSDDSAQTWTEPAVAIAGGSKPFGAVNPFDGTELIAAFVAASGKIGARRRYAGAADYSAEFFFKDSAGVDLLFEDDTFAFAWGFEGPVRLLLHAHIDGETATATFWSGDDGESFVRF